MIVCSLFFVIDVSAEETVVVEVSGVEGELFDNVIRFLNIQRLARDEDGNPITQLLLTKKTHDDALAPVTVAQIRRAHRGAPAQIRQALQPFGYYDPEINASLTEQDNVWRARYQIEAGVATTLSTPMQIDVQGDGQNDPLIDSSLKNLRSATLSRAGAVLSHAHYESTKKALIELALNNGYIDARYLESIIRVNRKRRSAEIVLTLDTGPRYEFGPVTIDQDALRAEVLGRFITIKQGEIFDSTKLTELQISLESSGYFDSVVVKPERSNAADGQIPVSVKTQLQKPRHYSAAFGFGTDTGPRLKLKTDFRRINDRGHKISADARVSALGYAVAGQYEVSSWQVNNERWVYNLQAINDDIVDQETQHFTLGASRFDEWRGFVRQFYSNVSREQFNIGNISTESTLLVVGASLYRQSTDDPLFVRRGYSISLDLHGGLDSFGSDTTYAQAEVVLRGVYPVAEQTRLLGHFAYGITEVDDFSRLPLGERFFSGGDRSVRGYKFQSLTPEDVDGNALGARFMIAAGLEAERMVRGNFGVAGFIDVGNASNETLPKLKTGIGLGLRYRAPIGIVRVDFAHPVDDDQRDFRLHISIGGDL